MREVCYERSLRQGCSRWCRLPPPVASLPSLLAGPSVVGGRRGHHRLLSVLSKLLFLTFRIQEFVADRFSRIEPGNKSVWLRRFLFSQLHFNAVGCFLALNGCCLKGRAQF